MGGLFPALFACAILVWQVSLLYQISIISENLPRNPVQPTLLTNRYTKQHTPVLQMPATPTSLPTPSANQINEKIQSPTIPSDTIAQVYNNVHAFYYGWYGNPKTNGKWMHWNHEVLPNWRNKVHPPPSHFQPPENIGANYYPELGPYSSGDPAVIEIHAQQFAASGIGNAVISWYPMHTADAQLASTPGYSDSLMKKMLEIFPKYGVKVSVHIEPYEGRNAESVRNDIEYIVDNYSGPGFYLDHSGKPMIYIYDSYHTSAKEWSRLLSKDGDLSIRNSKYDCTVISLYLGKSDDNLILQGGFDGFYTYFGSVGFTYGSTPSNWNQLKSFATRNNKIFIPSVSPGYVDTQIRPWNAENTKDRKDGEYYDNMWSAAVDCGCEYVSITSFNEWHEGSQIEPAVPYKTDKFTYLDYLPHSPNYYLERTKYWANTYNS